MKFKMKKSTAYSLQYTGFGLLLITFILLPLLYFKIIEIEFIEG
jgi:hypothetical protein